MIVKDRRIYCCNDETCLSVSERVYQSHRGVSPPPNQAQTRETRPLCPRRSTAKGGDELRVMSGQQLT